MTSAPPTVAPFVVAIGGLPGAGKSTLGRAVALALRAALLDQDTLTNPLVAQLAAVTGAGDNLDHPSLRGAVRQARYQCLADTAGEVAGAGCPAVLVAPFTAELADPASWQQFSAGLVTSAGLPADRVLLVRTTIDPEIAVARRAGRGLARDRTFTPPAAADQLGAEDLLADGAGDPAAEAHRIVDRIRTLLQSAD